MSTSLRSAPASAETLRVRQTTVDDFALVMHHRRAMFRDMGFEEDAVSAAMQASEPFFRRCFESDLYFGWLVEEDTSVVAGGGIVLLDYHAGPRDPQPRRPMAVNVYTEPEHRRRGHARRLMQAMTAWAKAAGYRALFLHASRDGRPLYDSLGFEPTNEMHLRLR